MKFFPKAGLALVSIAGLFATSFSLPVSAAVKPNPISSGSSGSTTTYGKPGMRGEIDTQASRAAQSVLNTHASEWGITASQFKLVRTIPGLAGMTTFRFQQEISGIEVAGSLVAITLSASGTLLSSNILASDYSGNTQANLEIEQARSATVREISSETGVDISSVAIEQTSLVIVDSKFVTGMPEGQRLVWRSVTSTNGDISSMSTTYLDDATGKLLGTFPLVRGITAPPLVCELQLVNPAVTPGVQVLGNGKIAVNIGTSNLSLPLCGATTGGLNSAETAISATNITRTWDYFSTYLGTDINEEKFLGNISPTINADPGPRISAFVDVCATGTSRGDSCPYGNAFWVPWASSDCNSTVCSGIFMGENFDHADDVIAHELSHGVTYALAFNAGMADNSETAALSEAVSDIFGEAVDQLTVVPGEAPDPTWMLGEDVQAGGFRNMQSPNVSKIDKNWRAADSHENSGPVNRLAWLLANGGKVGKTKIKAIGSTPATPGLCTSPAECTGITNVTALTFAAVSSISASASYVDFGRAFINACDAYVANGTPGFTKKVCKNVGVALKAQGFTKYSVTGLTKVGKVKRDEPTIVEATLVSSTGAPVAGQTAALQYKKGSKWKTIVSGQTDGSGKISFTANWLKSVSYRISSSSNGGLFEANSKTAKVTVR